jgi:NADPH-dependent ferric siderophore reductase
VVAARDRITARLVRVTLTGADLGRLVAPQPASSIRLLVPDPADPDRIDLPDWDGNRFVRPDGSRPALRTMTPRGHDPGRGELRLEVVTHGVGLASTWAASAELGTPVALSGPARGHDIDGTAISLVLGGDETAYAAVSSLIEAAAPELKILAVLETADGQAPPWPSHPGLESEVLPQVAGQPGRALAARLGSQDLPPDGRLWAAGEAAAMQELRRRLFGDRGLPRGQATIRGYWKFGRTSDQAAGNDN